MKNMTTMKISALHILNIINDINVINIKNNKLWQQARMFFEDELIALRDQNKVHADDALEEEFSKGNQRDLFAGAISTLNIFILV